MKLSKEKATELLLVGNAYSNYNTVRILLSNGADPTTNKSYVLRCASEIGAHKIVELLLNDGRSDPSDYDNQAIQDSSAFGRHEVVKLLLNDKRVNPTVDNHYAMRIAYDNCHHEVVELLKKWYIDNGVKLPYLESIL